MQVVRIRFYLTRNARQFVALPYRSGWSGDYVSKVRRCGLLFCCRGNIDYRLVKFLRRQGRMPQLVRPIGNEPLHALCCEGRGE